MKLFYPFFAIMAIFTQVFACYVKCLGRLFFEFDIYFIGSMLEVI